MSILVPKIIGPEKTQIEHCPHVYDHGGKSFALDFWKYTAFSGTGFDPGNPAHTSLPEGVSCYHEELRYAIAIQQLRDQKRYDEATAAQDEVKNFGLAVGTAKDRTVVFYPPPKKWRDWHIIAMMQGKAKGRPD